MLEFSSTCTDGKAQLRRPKPSNAGFDTLPNYAQYLRAHSLQGGALIIEICHFCPVGCAHCHIGSGPHSKQFQSPETIVESIRAFADLPDAEYVFCTGGEPFSDRRLLSIALQTTADCGLVSYTLTSGSWAKDDLSADEVLASLPPIKLFAVSIDRYHLDILGIQPPIAALRAAIRRGCSTFLCIGQMGTSDPIRETIISQLTRDILESTEIIYYPLLSRGNGAKLPELEGRELNRPATAPCFSIGAPLITANGRLVACCQTTQANRVRGGEDTPLHYGTGCDLHDSMRKYITDPFAKAIRTIGPAELAQLSKIECPADFNKWDICRACEYLHEPTRYQTALSFLTLEGGARERISLLDDILSEGSAGRLSNFYAERKD